MEKVDLCDACALVVLNDAVFRPVPITGVLLSKVGGWEVPEVWRPLRPPGPMPQLEDGVRHGFKVSRFPDSWPHWGDGAYSPHGPWHTPHMAHGILPTWPMAYSPHGPWHTPHMAHGMRQLSRKGVELRGPLAPFFSPPPFEQKKTLAPGTEHKMDNREPQSRF